MVNYRNQYEVINLLDGIELINDTPHIVGGYNKAYVMLAFYDDLGIDANQLTSIQRQIIKMQVLDFNNREQAKQFLQDWNIKTSKPKAHISKFIPGNHYHILDIKFNTETEAINYLISKGYEYAGLKVIHVYKNQSD